MTWSEDFDRPVRGRWFYSDTRQVVFTFVTNHASLWWVYCKASEAKCLLRGPHDWFALVGTSVICCRRCPVWTCSDGMQKTAWWYV